MSLQAAILLDIPDSSQTLTYTVNGSQVDQIVFANNQITFESTAGFNLSKSDFSIYIAALNTFLNALIVNFPNVQNSRGISLPLSSFELLLSSIGVEHLYYIQTSQGSSVYNTNYVPIAQSLSIASRSSITITLQEFFTCVQLQQIYVQQVNLN